MSKCLDCGCGLNGGICSNCHEELYIETYQGEYMDNMPSREFHEKAMQQQNQIEVRDKTIREDPAVFKDLKPTDNYYK